MKKSVYLILLFVLFGFAGGCDNPEQQQTARQLENQLSKGFTKLFHKKNGAGEEIEKLYQFEYTVFKMPAQSTSSQIEGMLNEMGRKRWDCFHVERSVGRESTDETWMFFCKRNPETPLRYVPKTLIGR